MFPLFSFFLCIIYASSLQIYSVNYKQYLFMFVRAFQIL